MNRGRIVGILLLALLTAGVCACGDRPDRPGNMSEESTQETAEAGYGAVLSLYKELSENNSIDAGTLSRRSEEAFFSDLYSVSVNMDVNPSRAGYALRDLNGDGTDEILLLEEDGILFAVFTRRSGQVVAVDYFSGSNNRGFIDEDGTIYKASLSKGESWGVKVTRILKDGDLDFLEFGIRDPDPGVVEPNAYIYRNGQEESADEATVNAMYEQYAGHIFNRSSPADLIEMLNLEFVCVE